jgi:[acyl-carrier-protein] S-malonyltransferase
MKNIAVLFPGGGTQYVGMGKMLFDKYKIVRELFEEANDILGYNLRKICFEGDLDKLSRMNNSQPAIFTVSVAAYQVLKQETGVLPAFACGHSLGEYTALTCSGALQFSEVLPLVKRRGELLQKAGNDYDATMMAVSKVSSVLVEEECSVLNENGGHVYVAVYNSDKQQVISGTRRDIAELSAQLAKRGAEPVILNINTPSHCPLMAQAAAEFKSELKQYGYSKPDFPVISNVTGLPYNDSDNVFDMLTQHMVQPVRWLDTINYLVANDIACAIDIGPQAVLKNLIPFITNRITAFAFDAIEDAIAIKQAFDQSNETLHLV